MKIVYIVTICKLKTVSVSYFSFFVSFKPKTAMPAPAIALTAVPCGLAAILSNMFRLGLLLKQVDNCARAVLSDNTPLF